VFSRVIQRVESCRVLVESLSSPSRVFEDPKNQQKGLERTREVPSRVFVESVESLRGAKAKPLHLIAYLSAPSSPCGSSGRLSMPL